MKKCVYIVIAVVVLFASCSKDKINTTEYSLSTSRCIDSTYNFYKNGRIIYDSVSSIAKYTDFESMKTVPLCSRPNCNHKNNECVAKLLGETPIVYNDKVYYLTYEDGVKENKYGKREYYVNSKLNCVSMETSEIKNIVEFHDCTPQLYGGYYLDGNNLYFVATDMGVEADEYGNIIYSNVGGKQFLCSINLQNGQYNNYGNMYEGDIQYEEAKNSRCAFIVGGRDSKINIFYSYIQEPRTPYKEFSTKDLIMLDIDFDIKTQEFSEGSLLSPSFSNEECFVGYDNKQSVMSVEYKEKKTVFEADDRDEVSVVNGKLFNANKGIWIDLDSNEEHSMGKYNGYIAITLWNDYYILAKGTSTVKITEEELMKL